MDYPEKKSKDDKAMFDDIVQGILSAMGDDVVKIILYGSVARGDNSWDSDIDIAVLTTKYYDWRARGKMYEDTWEYGFKYDTDLEIVPIEVNHYNALKNDKLFYRNIENDGIVLWTRPED